MHERPSNHSPEIIDPTIIDSIVGTATDAVNRYGDGHRINLAAPDITYKSASFLLRNHTVEGMAPEVVPMLFIDIPVGEYAGISPNRAEISLAYKDSALFRNYLVRKNNTIGRIRPGENPEDLNNQEGPCI